MNLIPFVTQTAMGIRKQLKIFGNDYNTPDKTCIRDYIYVVDLAKAHVKAMERVLDKPECEPVEVFNIGNVDKANKVLGWKAETPTEEILRTAWRWQQQLRERGIQ